MTEVNFHEWLVPALDCADGQREKNIIALAMDVAMAGAVLMHTSDNAWLGATGRAHLERVFRDKLQRLQAAGADSCR